MGEFFQHALLAWNPIRATRQRLEEGKLTFGDVVGPFLAVVIACNLLVFQAQGFWREALQEALQTDMPIPLALRNEFSLKLLAAVTGLLAPTIAALFPASAYAPVGRNATVASVLVLGGTWAFYGAALGVPVNYISGLLVSSNPEAGITFYLLLSIVMGLVITGLLLWFWIAVLRGVLKLAPGSVALIIGGVAAALFVILLIIAQMGASYAESY
jgi:hypothetical protein